MKKNIFVIILLAFPFTTVLPQTDNNKPSRRQSVSFEAGFIYPQGTIKESLSIRQNLSYYYVNQYSDGSISSSTSGMLLGARYEYGLPVIKSDISTGLRFVGINSEITGYASANSDFFYLRYSMEETDTKFARVKSLTECNYILSIPLEIRVYPLRYRNISFFAMAGMEYSVICFKKAADITFREEIMNPRKDVVLGNIAGPVNRNYSSFYSSIGLKFGREDKLNYTIEVMLPSFLLTGNNFYFIDVDYLEGFRLSVKLPLKSK